MKTKTITLVGIFAAVMCVLSPISIPMVPVPITLATLGVYIISALFDWKKAPLIMIIYILLGGIGMPVFSNGNAGFAVILGPTGGYIVSYIFCALVESLLIGKFKNKFWIYPVAMLIGTVVVYTFGTAWFMIYKGGSVTFAQAMAWCVTPFLIGDSIKIVIASLIGIKFRKMMDKTLG